VAGLGRARQGKARLGKGLVSNLAILENNN